MNSREHEKVKHESRSASGWVALQIGLIVIGILIVMEFASMLMYFYERGEISRLPYLGGEALQDTVSEDDYEFNPLTVFVNKEKAGTQGLYAKETIKLPPKLKKRVFFLGGSTVADIRKPQGDRIADHIQKSLELSGEEVDVFNFGVPSYTSLNEMYMVLSTLVYFEPDLVIFYDGVNDAHLAALASKEGWVPNLSPIALEYKARMRAASSLPLSDRVKNFLRAYSYTYYQIKKLVGRSTQKFSSMGDVGIQIDNATRERIKIDPVEYAKREIDSRPGKSRWMATYDPKVASVYINNVRFTARALEANGIPFLHVIQPTALTKKTLSEREKWSIDFNNANIENFEVVSKTIFAHYEKEQERLAREFKSGRTRFLNLFHLTDDYEEPLYDDYCHALRSGRLTEVVGKEIGAFILREKML